MRTIPSTQIGLYDFQLRAGPDSTTYWDIVGYVSAQLPILSAANVSAFLYLYLYPNLRSTDSTSSAASLEGIFALPKPASSDVLENLWRPIWQRINETHPGQSAGQARSILFPNLFDLFREYADASTAGVDKAVGSWLLPSDTLMDTVLLMHWKFSWVAGRGVWNAKPRGGDAVNPAWREALVHAGELGYTADPARNVITFCCNTLNTVTSQDRTLWDATQ